MFDFHSDKLRYFNIQKTVTTESILPILNHLSKKSHPRYVLEIGCAEAGVLSAFLEEGDQVVGIELSKYRYDLAKQFLAEAIKAGKAEIINENIYDIDPDSFFKDKFDVIILKDVIEHIPDQARFIVKLKSFLADDGLIFFAYPPWWMPFGGHQQICKSKFLRSAPWIHLLPRFAYMALLKVCKESQATIDELMDVSSTGIIIERLLHILQINNFKILAETYWFINPIYKFKFGLKPKKVLPFFQYIPYLRNFYTTAHYIVFAKG